jgi:hypothetical protein
LRRAAAPDLSPETSPVISGVGRSSGNLTGISALSAAQRTAPPNTSLISHGQVVAGEWQKIR